MALNKWIKPAQEGESTYFEPKDGIKSFFNSEPGEEQNTIGLLGIYEADANRVREQLYRFTIDFPEGMFMDFGNLIRPHFEDLKETLHLMLDHNVLPVVIGRKAPDSILDGSNGFTFQRPVHIESRLPDYLLQPIDGQPHYGAYGIIGLQRHFVERDALRQLREEEIEIYQLGDVRSDIRRIEPLLREGDSCFLSLNCIRYADCPGKRDFNPSGLFAEETCQIARYAGYSEEVQCLHVYDYLSERDQEGQAAHLLAQLIWYFIEGVSLRSKDKDAGSTAFQSYIIGDDALDYTLTFVHSQLSGRWWVVEGEVRDFEERSHWKACTEEDYRSAAKGEISDRLFRTIRTL